MREDICPKCKLRKPMTKHHIYPQRFFGTTKEGNTLTIEFCQECHALLESFIPLHGRRPREFYEQMVDIFLGGIPCSSPS